MRGSVVLRLILLQSSLSVRFRGFGETVLTALLSVSTLGVSLLTLLASRFGVLILLGRRQFREVALVRVASVLLRSLFAT